MDEKADALESIPLVDDYGGVAIERNSKTRLGRLGFRWLQNPYVQFFLWLLFLESINVFLFVAIPAFIRQQASEISDNLHELQSLRSLYNRTWVFDTAEGDDRRNFFEGGWDEVRLGKLAIV
ncbi:hypothetical protein F5Y03DRAFT_392542 [Xylaria venustula]|nr:hypothetical protein F5Y03DRAFT_392542 [Xylaria venustula]